MEVVIRDAEGQELARIEGREHLGTVDCAAVDLSDRVLPRAKFTRSHLEESRLDRAVLCDADFTGARLEYASFEGAELSRAILRGVSACRTDFRGAGLTGADLTGADLRCALFTGAALCDVVYDEATRWPDFHICPEEGAFTAYKAAYEVGTGDHVLVTLTIPEDARRTSSLVGRKCRASKAFVKGAVRTSDGAALPVGAVLRSGHDRSFHYRVGEAVVPHAYDDRPTVECAPGIHFFVTAAEAASYIP